MTGPIGQRPHMPDYGVDTDDWEPLPWAWAAERLASGRNYWLVTVSGAGRPHAMPVWGVWDDDELRFAFSCGPRSRKAANLAANPHVVVASEDTVEALSIEGQAQRVDGDRLEVWIRRYLDKYTADVARPVWRLHASEPRVRGRAATGAGDHRAGGGVRHAGDALAVRRVTRRGR